MSNKIVTSVSALTDDGIETYSDTGVVCIDTNQGFIGVHKSNPAFHIDVSGTIRCAELKIGSTTVNLSGQIDLIRTASNILPLVTDTYDLGSTSRFWSNAYIQDISASNISVSGDLEPFTTINTSKLGTTSKFWSNAYITNISASNISVSGDLEPFTTINTSKLGTTSKFWSNAYIQDISASNISVSGDLEPLIPNTSKLGSATKLWSNAYITNINAAVITISNSAIFTGSVSGITKTMVGLSNVNNTTDADKQVSTATRTELNLKANISGGTFTGPVIFNSTVSGITKTMVGLSNVNNTTDADKEVSTATRTELNLKANISGGTFTGPVIFNSTVSGITKTMVGLSNVNNTSDVDKQVSTATRTELNLKANISGGTFTGPVIFNNLASTTFNSSATFTSTSSMNDISANNITTTTNNFGFIGTTLRRWGDGYINNLYSYIIRPTDYVLSSIGTFDAFWPLVYIKDIVATTMTISGSLTISGSFIPRILTGQAGGGLGLVNNRWAEGYINSVITYYIAPGDGASSIGLSTSLWPRLFIRDISATNISAGNMSVTRNIVPFINLSGSLGTTDNKWKKAFISDLSSTNITVSEIAYEPIPIWVASGYGGNTIAYSYDGSTNWIGLGTDIFSNLGRGVAYNGTMWVAVGTGTTHTIAYSYDGINWTGIGKNIFTTNGLGIAYNGTMWLALGNGMNAIAYSSNGITWDGIEESTNTFTGAAYDAAWNGTMWVAVGIGTNSIIYSLNGIDWTPVPNSTTTFSVAAHKIAWNGTIWVAVGRGANSIAYSFDGSTNWYGIPNSIDTFTTNGWGIAYNGTMWVAVGDGTNSIAYSYDGSTNWTGIRKTNTNTFTNFGVGVAWNGTMWVALGYGTNSIIYSLNGTTWYPVPNSTNIFSGYGQGVASGYTPKPLRVSRSIIPSNSTYNLGSTTNYWFNAYIQNAYIQTISASNININGGSIGNVSSTQLSHLQGASSNIQTQINTLNGRITTLEDRIGWTGTIAFSDDGIIGGTENMKIVIKKGGDTVGGSAMIARAIYPGTYSFSITTQNIQGATRNQPLYIGVKPISSYMSIGTTTFNNGPSYLGDESEDDDQDPTGPAITYKKYKIPFNTQATLDYRFTSIDSRTIT